MNVKHSSCVGFMRENGCGLPLMYTVMGYCRKCYRRWRYHNDPKVRESHAGYYQKSKAEKPDYHARQYQRAKARRSELRNTDAGRRLIRDRHRERRFGLSPDMVRSLWEVTGGRCGICRTQMEDVGSLGHNNCAVDHCHVTGRVRGLLCRICNTSLGMYEKYQRGSITVEAYERWLE